MGGFGVEVCAVLAWASFTPAVPAIIETENGNARFEQGAAGVQAMTDVSGVSVAEEHGEVGAWRIGVGGIKPAVQLNTIAGLEIDIFERATQFGSGGFQEAIRMIDLAVFEPTQHDVGRG